MRHVNFFEVIRLNVQIFCAFEVRPEVTNILVTRDNTLHQKRIYLKKNENSIFKYNVKAFRNKPYVKYVFWKAFKNSIKLLTSPFLVTFQTFFIRGALKGHSKSTLRYLQRHLKDTWALGHSRHLDTWRLRHLGTPSFEEHLGIQALRHLRRSRHFI